MSTDPKKRVALAAQRPENQRCADCGCKLLTSSIWASSTLGIFICINCSGRHRNLGTHITFVRSVGLDSWTDEQATVMEQIGNEVSNAYWEANLPSDYPRPATEDLEGLTKFIRLKYELGKWADKTRKPPHILLQEGKKPAKKAKVAKMPTSQSSQPVSTPKPQVIRSNSTNLLDFNGTQQQMPQSNSVDLLFGTAPQPQVQQNTGSFSSPFGGSQQRSPQHSQGTASFQPFSPSPVAQQAPMQSLFGAPQPQQARPQQSFGFPQQQQSFGFPQQQQSFGFPQQQHSPQPSVSNSRDELKSMLSSSSHPQPSTSTGVFRQGNSQPFSSARAQFVSGPAIQPQQNPQQQIRGPHGPRPKPGDAFSGISPF